MVGVRGTALGVGCLLALVGAALGVELQFFTPSSDVSVSFFSMQLPTLSEDHCSDDGADYYGEVHTTVNNNTCIEWPKAYTDVEGQLSGLEAGAFCRNPDGSDSPWCFIAEGVREDCNVTSTLRPLALRFFSKEAYNRTDVTVAASGEECASHTPFCAYDARREEIGCEVGTNATGFNFAVCDLSPCCETCGTSLLQETVGGSKSVLLSAVDVFHVLRPKFAEGRFRMVFHTPGGDPTSAVSGAVVDTTPQITFSQERSVIGFVVDGLGEPVCSDDPEFVDQAGFPCDLWVRGNCAGAMGDYGYSVFGTLDLLTSCPVTCETPYATCGEVCMLYQLVDAAGDGWEGAWMTISSCDETQLTTVTLFSGGQRSGVVCTQALEAGVILAFSSLGNYPGEISWTMGFTNGLSFSGGVNGRRYCPGVGPQCPDDPGFRDAGNSACSAWVGKACMDGLTVEGFSMAETLALLKSCPATCGLQQSTCEDACVLYDLVDSYGDGWNGATIALHSCEDTLLDTLSISNGFHKYGTLCDDSLRYGVKVSFPEAGSWPDEVSWTLGFADGPPISGPITTMVSGCDGCMTVELLDTYGDGWSGAEMVVHACDGSPLRTFGSSFTSGAVATSTLCADFDAGFSVVWTAADSFPEEVRWNVTLRGESYAGDMTDFTTCTELASASPSDTPSLSPSPSPSSVIPPDPSWTDELIPTEPGVFVWEFGNDLLLGDTPDNAVRTLSRGASLASESPSKRLYVLPGSLPVHAADAVELVPAGSSCVDVRLADSYGDGWNNAELTVLTCDGTVQGGPITLDSGYTQTVEMCFDTLAGFVVEVTPGYYPSEVSWTIAALSVSGVPGSTDVACSGFSCSDSGVAVSVASASDVHLELSTCDNAPIGTVTASDPKCVDSSLLLHGFRVSASSADPTATWSMYDANRRVYNVSGDVHSPAAWGCDEPRSDFRLTLSTPYGTYSWGDTQATVYACNGTALATNLVPSPAGQSTTISLGGALADGFMLATGASVYSGASPWTLRVGLTDPIAASVLAASSPLLELASGLERAFHTSCEFTCASDEHELTMLVVGEWDGVVTLHDCQGTLVFEATLAPSNSTVQRACVPLSALASGVSIGIATADDVHWRLGSRRPHGEWRTGMGSWDNCGADACALDPRSGDGFCDADLNEAPCWDGGDCCSFSCQGARCAFSDRDCAERTLAVVGVVDADGQRPVVTTPDQVEYVFHGGVEASLFLRNLTFRSVNVDDALVVAPQGTTVVIEECEFEGVSGSSGSVVQAADSTVSVFNSLFIGNAAVAVGGVVSVSGGAGAASFSDSTFEGNSAGLLGGDVFASEGSAVTISDCRSTASTAAGGGSVAVLHGSLHLQDSFLVCNASALLGGCLLGVGATATVQDTTMHGTAAYGGGTIAVALDSALSVLRSTLHLATSPLGGAVYCRGSELALANVELSDNAGDTGAAVYSDSCAVTLSGCSLHDNTAAANGGGVFSTLGITADDCSFVGNAANSGGGAYVGDGDSVIVDSSFASNTASEYGGALAIVGQHGTLTIQGSTLTANTAAKGGAIHSSGATVVLGGAGNKQASTTALSANSAAQNGGALHAVESDVHANGIVVHGNSAAGSGGGLFSSSSTVVLQSSVLSENTAQHGGGASTTATSLTAVDSTFTSNTASAFGGGLHSANDRSTIVTNALFANNTATDGGAVHASAVASAAVQHSRFENNAATEDGGALWVLSSSLQADHLSFVDNHAGGDGGGAVLNTLVTGSRIRDCEFEGNAAGANGGGVLASSVVASLTNLTFARNRAENGGALAAVASPFTEFANSSFSHNEAAFYGGGMYLVDSRADYAHTTLAQNRAKFGGGIVAVQFLQGDVAFTNVTFAANQADEGGGILLSDSFPILRNSRFVANSAGRCGGVMATRFSLELTATHFEGNTATTGEGGAMCSGNSETLTISACTFNANHAATDGGALSLADSPAGINSIANTALTSNAAGRNGGAVSASLVAWNVVDSVLASNSAGFDGGSVFSSGTLRMDNCVAERNTAAARGGGVMLSGALSFVARSSTFRFNAAATGGGLSSLTTPLDVGACVFQGNQATESGGGAYVAQSSQSSFESTSFLSNSASQGSGGALMVVDSGTVAIVSSNFSSNQATQGGGGGVFFDGAHVTQEGSSFENNTASFGTGLGSEVATVEVSDQLDGDPVVGKFFSGSIVLTMRDAFGQVVSASKATTASVDVVEKERTDLVGSRLVEWVQGVAVFDSLGLQRGCDTTYTLVFRIPNVNVSQVSLSVFLECENDAFARDGLLVVGCIFAALDLFLMYLIYANKRAPLVIRSSPQFCLSQLFGDLVMLCGVIAYGLDPSVAVCCSSIFLWSTGFTIAYGSLFLKTWRVMKLFSNKSLARLTLPNSFLFGWLSALLSLDTLLLILTFVFWTPDRDTVVLKSQEMQYEECNFHLMGSPLMIMLGLFKFAMVLYGAGISYKVSKVFSDDSNAHRAEFNESKYIGYCLYNILFLLCIVVPVVGVLGAEQWKLRTVLVAVTLILTTQFNALLLFIPKVAKLYSAVITTGGVSRTSRIKSILDPSVIIALQQKESRRPTIQPRAGSGMFAIPQAQLAKSSYSDSVPASASAAPQAAYNGGAHAVLESYASEVSPRREDAEGKAVELGNVRGAIPEVDEVDEEEFKQQELRTLGEIDKDEHEEQADEGQRAVEGQQPVEEGREGDELEKLQTEAQED